MRARWLDMLGSWPAQVPTPTLVAGDVLGGEQWGRLREAEVGAHSQVIEPWRRDRDRSHVSAPGATATPIVLLEASCHFTPQTELDQDARPHGG